MDTCEGVEGVVWPAGCAGAWIARQALATYHRGCWPVLLSPLTRPAKPSSSCPEPGFRGTAFIKESSLLGVHPKVAGHPQHCRRSSRAREGGLAGRQLHCRSLTERSGVPQRGLPLIQRWFL